MHNTAVADEVLQRNPCTVRGAGVSNAAERSVAAIVQVNALAEAVPPRYRMLILLAAWSGARWGELVALTRDSLDLKRGVMTMDRQYVELRDGSLVLDTPKTAAGVRNVHIPPHLIPELQLHVDTWTTPSSPVVFPNSKDEPIRRSSWRSVWLLARDKAGLPHLRIANAVIHRDYRLTGAVRVEHAPTRLSVRSPGPLVQGVTSRARGHRSGPGGHLRRRTTDEYDRKVVELVRESGTINARLIRIALDLAAVPASRLLADLLARSILVTTSEAPARSVRHVRTRSGLPGCPEATAFGQEPRRGRGPQARQTGAKARNAVLSPAHPIRTPSNASRSVRGCLRARTTGTQRASGDHRAVVDLDAGIPQVSDLGFWWSGRRESNPRSQLGKLMFCR